MQAPAWISRPFVLFWACALVYFALGYWLAVDQGLVDGDGPSRVSNGGFVVFSRDPHAAAVGFVWNPLPSFVEIPFLLLRHLWPALQTESVAGIIQSALFMAGSVALIRGIARDQGLSRWLTVTLVALFALNPMIVEYGGNGLSEASLLFFTIWASRALLRWLASHQTIDLLWCGLALGLGSFARYEELAAAGSAAIAVGAATIGRRVGDSVRQSAAIALHRVILLLFPIGVSFATWSISSWLLTGDVLAQFQSQYGNSAQLGAMGGSTGPRPFLFSFQAIVSTEPLMPVVLVCALTTAIAAKRWSILALGPTAGVLFFEVYAAISGSTFGWFRFYIMTVPLTVIALMIIAGAPNSRRAFNRVRTVGALALTVLALAVSIPVTAISMLNPAIGNQPEQYALAHLFEKNSNPNLALYYGETSAQSDIADYLDRLHLPEGSVLLDPFFGTTIWLATLKDKQFVVASDYDFLDALNNPRAFGIQYILAPNPAGEGGLNEVNVRYPTLWKNGAGIATPVVTFNGGPDQTDWRIYRVNQ